MAAQGLSKGEKRRDQILALLKSGGKVSVQEIMDRFSVSEATARRDLDELARSGGVIRTIGGALFEGFSLSREPSFNERKKRLWAEKAAIADLAATFVQTGDVVGLTGGTTTFLIARALQAMQGITVVTNSVNVAYSLAENDGIQVVVTGGVMRGKSYELCGPLAETIVGQLHISKMFVGLDGISKEQGLTTYSEQEAQIARLMIGRSLKTYSVFDHSKANRASLFTIVPLANIDACITDAQVDGGFAASLQDLGIELHIAKGNDRDGQDVVL
ncbi:MAG TPA: DeoR/GlpR family DNA-binding transcription regulator [Bacilli bacterium]